jgi:hypothetical protein
MKFVCFMVSAMVTACTATAVEAGSSRQKVRAQPAPQSREAIYASCRQQAFRKFGWHNGSQVVLYTDFFIQQVDYCVSNDGRL